MSFDPQEHLMKVRGGQLYLEVKWRLVWLREEHPDASVEVELTHLDLDGKMAVARATVTLPNGTKATEIGSETEKDFPAGWVEKAATKAVGRALAALGFGTQFALELEEGERLADSPVNPKNPAATTTAAGVTPLRPAERPTAPSGPGNDAEHAPAAKAPQTPAQGFVEAAAVALAATDGPAAPTARPGAKAATDPVDPVGTLRAEVVALCSVDGEALEILRKWAGDKVPAEWTEEQLRKALPRLQGRIPRSTQLSARIAHARSDAEVLALLEEADQAKVTRAISQVEYLGLHREAQTRKAALSGPLTAGAGLGVAS